MDAENTHQVFDWLWSSGQLSERDIDQLPALGIQAVINLALPTSPQALVNEADRIARLGIAYVQIPVLWEDPKPEQFHQFAAILEAFRGRKVWVHCAKNMRASAFIHLYRRQMLGHTEAESSGLWLWGKELCSRRTRWMKALQISSGLQTSSMGKPASASV